MYLLSCINEGFYENVLNRQVYWTLFNRSGRYGDKGVVMTRPDLKISWTYPGGPRVWF